LLVENRTMCVKSLDRIDEKRKRRKFIFKKKLVVINSHRFIYLTNEEVNDNYKNDKRGHS